MSVTRKRNPNAPVIGRQIRWMIRCDMPAVFEIENRSYRDPWTEEDFLCELRQRNCIGLVVETDREHVVGFMVYEIWKRCLRLLNLAVHPDARRLGLGTDMVGNLKSQLSSKRRHTITLEIVEWNTAGHLFFQSQGFRAVDVMREFYGTGDTAYTMEFCV